MYLKKFLVLCVFISFLSSCSSEKISAEIPAIIPLPNQIELNKGYFTFDSQTVLEYSNKFQISGDFLKQWLQLNTTSQIQNSNRITFIYDETIINPEGYELLIREDDIVIRSSTDHGAFYAVQTLRQLLPPSLERDKSMGSIKIPCLSIKDAPSFKYRGMHLDVGRHMFSIDFIKKYIDALALLKMNTFHWHLTEDQGWRIEIKSYPKLQDIAAYRDETLIGHYSDQPHQFDGNPYGGYYTQEEIKSIVAYAESRHITIIPEIELPGHAQAAISAYPELGCTGEQVPVATKWGVFEHIYCTKDETFEFLENVLNEVIALFPGKYIHIGGDEAPKTNWKACIECQQRIRSEGLKDEHELQNYFITRIEKYLNSKGKQIIGWDEILEGGLAPNATVMSWRGINGAVEAAKQNHNVILTPTSHCYFDYYQSTNENEPLAIGGYLPLEKVYSFNPIPDELNEDEAKYVLGAQGNIWTEYMPTSTQVEYMAFPRMLAMSEVVWSNETQKDYLDFIRRLEFFHKRMDFLDINYANHLYEINGQINAEDGKSNYTLSTLIDNKTIRYTLNGSEPHSDSKIYAKPIVIDSNLTIKAAVFNNDERLSSVFTETITYHKAVGKSIKIDKKPHASYSGSGAQGLINGIVGSSKRYGDKEWLGFWGEDIEITVDLGETKNIQTIETRFHNGKGQWIYAPNKVTLEFDNDLIINELHPGDEKHVSLKIGTNQRSRYVKLSIPNYGIIPDGYQGAGNKAWTFIDEIIIQ